MLRQTTALALAMMALAASGTMVRADEAQSHWRVFVGDHSTGKITAIDLDKPDQRWSFEVKSHARLYPFGDGAGIAVVQAEADRADFLKSGITLESHGDHADLEVSDPALLSTSMEGGNPVHVVEHSGVLAINFDKDAKATLADVKGLLGGDPQMRDFPQEIAHHGFVAVFGDYVLSTVSAKEKPEGASSLPRLGLQAFTADGKPVSDLASCPGIHGEAFSGAYLAAGCEDGILTVKTDKAKPEFSLLPYPADFPKGKTGTLLGVKGMQAFLGNYGADGLVVVDPADAPHFTRVTLPFRRVDFVLDPAKPQAAYVLTEDGTLHRLNILSGEIEASGKVSEPYSMDGHWRDPRPRLAVAGDTVVMTDPNKGLLRLISTADLKQTGEIPVEGMPYTIAITGGSGINH
ncbi:metallochaperone AztD [Pannonibacter phragmitetus]|uniref:metallochaperone AztD n=2 Tax=Pannonibacter phragmitetus TaxID=121719 RepID=UPI001AD8B4FA|nr:metallochaperone AztD [Pannonibacter phragmitetus]